MLIDGSIRGVSLILLLSVQDDTLIIEAHQQIDVHANISSIELLIAKPTCNFEHVGLSSLVQAIQAMSDSTGCL